jgi:glycosyltransferase involved in cell wall biosynthesis
MQPGNGVAYHRQWLPLMEMRDVAVLFADFINDEVMQRGFDIVLINRHIPGMELETLLDFRKRYDFKLVVDIDDYWHLDPWHILSHNYPTQKIVSHIVAADLVTCTHRRLWQEIKQYNKNVEVIANALPYGRDQFHSEKVVSDNVQDDRLRVVYAGSVTHEHDLRILRNPFRKIATDRHLRERLHFILCGYSGDEAPASVVKTWHNMIHSYLAGFKLNGYVRGGLPPEQYMAFYNEADICVAPLVDTKFNNMKSNLKILEAAAKKAPIIVSDIHPYSSCPTAWKVQYQHHWHKAFRELAGDDDLRTRMGQETYEWAVEHYHLDKWNKIRKAIYEMITR